MKATTPRDTQQLITSLMNMVDDDSICGWMPPPSSLAEAIGIDAFIVDTAYRQLVQWGILEQRQHRYLIARFA